MRDVDLELIGFDLPFCADLDHRAKLIKPYYVLWQLFALVYVFVLTAAGRLKSFSVVHHLTYNVVDFPGMLWALPNTKFVWGPVGGGQVPPPMSKRLFGSAWPKTRIRAFAKSLIRWNPVVRLAVWRASVVIGANEDTGRILKDMKPRRYLQMLETAIHPVGGASPRVLPLGFGHKRILWVGRLDPGKGVFLALDIFRSLITSESSDRYHLTIVGSGPQFDALRECVRQDQVLIGKVDVVGNLPFADVQQLYNDSDLFLFTSMQDTSGNVILEALRSGMPVVAPDHQGARSILSRGGGFRFRTDNYEAAVGDAAAKVRSTLTDPAVYTGTSKAALEAVSNYLSWSVAAVRMHSIYDEVL